MIKKKCDHCEIELKDIDAFVDFPDYFEEFVEGELPRKTFCLNCLSWNSMQMQMLMNRNIIALAHHYEKLLLKHGIIQPERLSETTPKGDAIV